MCILETAEFSSSEMDIISYNQLPNPALCIHMQEPDQGIPYSAKLMPVLNLFCEFRKFSTIRKNISMKIFDTWHAVCTCSEIISYSSKIAIHENSDP